MMPLSAVFVSLVFLSGCVPVVVGTAGIIGGVTVAKDKNIGTSINDTKIETAIKSRLYKINPRLYSDVSVLSDRGAVLLTGTVQSPEYIEMSEKEAWSVEGVIIVDNNLTSGDQLSLSVVMADGLITSKARASILCNKDIKSVNYKLKTMNGVIYVTGIARSDKEINAVLTCLQGISGAKKVVSYVTVNN